MTDRPVVIAGLDRAGKTQLRRMLEEGTDIAFFRRAELWTHHFGRYGDLRDHTSADRAVRALAAAPGSGRLISDSSRLLSDFLQGPPTYGHLFALVGRQFAELAGARRWGDQAALAERHTDAIFDALPEARIVHMIRDPRDRFASALAGHGVGLGGIAAACDDWLESSTLALANSNAYSGRYLAVRFEDLVGDPIPTMTRILDFIGVASRADTAQPIADRAVGQVGMYAHALSPRAITLVEESVLGTMRRFNYEPASAKLGAMDRLRLSIVDRPLARITTRARRHGRSREWTRVNFVDRDVRTS